MQLQEVKDLAVRLMAEFDLGRGGNRIGASGILGGGWEFCFNRRSRFNALCKFPPLARIELAQQYCLLNNRPHIENTIRHEIAHALAGNTKPYHGEHWKAMCAVTGAKPLKHADLEGLILPERYCGVCRGCYSLYIRWHKPSPDRNYVCRACKSPLVFTKVGMEKQRIAMSDIPPIIMVENPNNPPPSAFDDGVSMSQESSQCIVYVYEYPSRVKDGWKFYPIRIVGPRISRCHNKPTVLVQSMEGGFVSANCSECGGKDTFSADEFVALGLWVSCPLCAQRMVAQMVRSNYSFVCFSCSRYTKLAEMLPKWEDLLKPRELGSTTDFGLDESFTAVFQPGDSVTIVSGTFAGMSGAVISEADALARWPERSPHLEVDGGDAFWVVLQIFGREVPVVMSADQLAAG